MPSKSVLLKSTPVLLLVLGALLYPRLTQYAQDGKSKQIAMPETTTFRVLLGVGDTVSTNWDGSVKLTGGKVTGIQGWRFAENDSSDDKSSWKVSTRGGGAIGAGKKGGQKKGPGPVLENGVLISAALANPEARFDIRTSQGSFAFMAREIPAGGSNSYLDGKVTLDTTPSTTPLPLPPPTQA